MQQRPQDERGWEWTAVVPEVFENPGEAPADRVRWSSLPELAGSLRRGSLLVCAGIASMSSTTTYYACPANAFGDGMPDGGDNMFGSGEIVGKRKGSLSELGDCTRSFNLDQQRDLDPKELFSETSF